MAFIPLPFGIKVVISFDKDGQTCLNVMYCTKNTPAAVNMTDLTNATGAWQAWWNAMRNVASNQTRITQIEAIDWSSEDGPSYVLASPANPTGFSVAATLPNNVTVACTHITGRRGRSQRGRSYVIGLPTGALISQNRLTGGAGGTILGAFNALKAALTTVGLTHCVASFETGGAPRVTAQGTAIVSYALDDTLDSQRRRLPGRGI